MSAARTSRTARTGRTPRRTAARAGAALALAILAAGTCVPGAVATEADGSQDAATDASPEATDGEPADELSGSVAYPGNPVTEPALVADEEERLNQVRTVASMIRWRSLDVEGAYRLSTGSTYTLVLTKRDAPYGIAELLALAPQTFVREPDGAYLLTENIVVQPGAVLSLQDAGPLTIRLASDAARFVSIVNMGGQLVTRGTSAAPVTITSWDRDAGGVDTTTDDGRAYIRSIGGQVDLEGTTFTDLGFWSGRTGGVALTGSDKPSEGALDDFGRELRDAVAATAVPPGSTTPEGGDPAQGELVDPSTSALVEGLLPAGELPVPVSDPDDPSYSYVSARVEDSVFRGNAFGLFVSGANGVDISGVRVEDSLVDGLVLHRFVTNATISGTLSQENAGDGIILARATTGITLSEVESAANGGSGIVIQGGPLAEGPNASGVQVGDYGNNTVANSLSRDNARYGVEVVGGRNIDVSANDVEGNDMGIVVRDGAREVSLVGNRLVDNDRHAVALRDGVEGAIVSGNVVSGATTGLFLRDSTATVERNTMSGLTNHAVTLVGATEGSTVAENTLAGRGPSAIDRKRADGVTVGENDLSSWENTKPFWTVVRNALQPLTVLWLSLALIVVVTAVRGARHRTAGRRHPYQAQRRMAELTGPPVLPGTVVRHDGTHGDGAPGGGVRPTPSQGPGAGPEHGLDDGHHDGAHPDGDRELVGAGAGGHGGGA